MKGAQIDIGANRAAFLRRPVAGLVTALLLLSAVAAGAQTDNTVRRVVLIHFDTARVDDFGCYGSFVRTPAVDALAENGFRYTNAITCSPYTSPSVATCLTGLYPSGHGVRTVGVRLAGELTTLPELFNENGFVTAAFVSNSVLLKTPHIKNGLGYEQGFDVWHGIGEPEAGARSKDAHPGEAPDCQKITEEAIQFIRQHRQDKFFLWMLHFDPHTPYDPPPPYDSMYLNQPELLAETVELKAERWKEAPFRYSHEYVARHKGEVSLTDRQVGRLVQELDTLEGKTLFIVLADHGESFGDDGLWFDHGHNVRYPSIRVPLIICCDGVVPPGRSHALVDNTDIAPTILEIAAIAFDAKAMDGRSLTPTFATDDPWPDRKVPMAVFWREDRSHDRRVGVRSKFYSLQCAYAEGGGLANAWLYDHRADPQESNDIKGQFPQVLESHLAFLDEWNKKTASAGTRGELGVDPEMRERLKALGYVE